MPRDIDDNEISNREYNERMNRRLRRWGERPGEDVPAVVAQDVEEPEDTARLNRLRDRYEHRYTQFGPNPEEPEEPVGVNPPALIKPQRGYATRDNFDNFEQEGTPGDWRFGVRGNAAEDEEYERRQKRMTRRDKRHAVARFIDPDATADLEEKERLGNLYYLRHPVRGVAEGAEAVAETIGGVRDYGRRWGEKQAGNPPTEAEIAKETARKAAELGITPEQFHQLQFEKLRGQALAKAYGMGTSTRPSGAARSTGRYRSASPLSYGTGLGTMSSAALDMWGRPLSQVGRGLNKSYLGNSMGIFGDMTRDGGLGQLPTDMFGNPLITDRQGNVRSQFPLWAGSANPLLSPQNWFKFGNGNGGGFGDYLGGFRMGAGGTGGIGFDLSGFNLNGSGSPMLNDLSRFSIGGFKWW